MRTYTLIMTKDDFMKHVFEYKSDVYDNDYRAGLTIISNMLDPLEDWQNKTGVKGMSFDMVVPLYNFKRVNESLYAFITCMYSFKNEESIPKAMSSGIILFSGKIKSTSNL